MHKGRVLLSLALAAFLAGAALPVTAAAAAAKGTTTASASARKSYAFRQFTGVVTQLDKGSLTVEKSGKAAKTMVFSRHAEMRTQGDLETSARVTVYWRDDAGKPVAHKVVVKTATAAAKG
jgi:hypothetical protein